jgi:CDP-glycerol glycerophosphotransferase (TagB/SpsB family)
MSSGHSLSINNHVKIKAKGPYYDGSLIRAWVIVRIMKIRGDVLYIKGSHVFDNVGECECCFVDDKGRKHPLTVKNRAEKSYEEHDGLLINVDYFEAEIELADVKQLEFKVCPIDDDASKAFKKPFTAPIVFGKYAKLFTRMKEAYYAKNGYLMTVKNKRLLITRAGRREEFKREIRYSREIIAKDKKYYLAFVRILAFFKKAFKKRPVWIFSDRDNAAGDNGEALFKYAAEHEKDAKLYFAVSGDSPDYSRMKKYGSVLKIGSLKYLLTFLAADKILSSQTGEWVCNAFGDDQKYVKSLYDFDYIFLQHGIILNDLSVWFRYYHKDMAMFVTTAQREYEAILGYGYNCDERVVKLTGLPRFDYLTNAPEKKVVFMPTWRSSIAGEPVPGTAHRAYSESFRDSEFFRFYNGLINNSRLVDCLKQHGYTGELYIHPAFSVQAVDFESNDAVKVMSGIADYNKVFRENSLLVTDYSSVAFDFAYLKKPLVYTQFDAEDFYSGHHCSKGYFDYVTDGFGPVTADVESAVDAITAYVSNGCIMEDKYRQRVEDFFSYTDTDNCRRVLEAIRQCC